MNPAYQLPITFSSSPYNFFFNDTATTEIYTLSLHDALPISIQFENNAKKKSSPGQSPASSPVSPNPKPAKKQAIVLGDRKSTRLNSSHQIISYAVFCLKKKKNESDPRDAVALSLWAGYRFVY